jgi:hemolysin III
VDVTSSSPRGVVGADAADDEGVAIEARVETIAPGDPAQRHPAHRDGWRRRVSSKPLLRGRIHQVAALLSIPAGLVLFAFADSALTRVAVVVYAVSLTALFSTSASYHLSRGSARLRLFLRRMDHSMIYVLIGGCYTPICLLALPTPIGVILLAAVWATVAFGVTLKMTRLGDVGSPVGSLGSALYIVLGWSAVIALPWLFEAVGWMGLALMLAGGLLYTVGAVTLATRRPDPVPHVFGYHEVWHAMGVTGAAIHYVLIFTLVA